MRGAPMDPREYAAGDGAGETPVLTDEKLAADGWAFGLKVWEQVGKAYEWYLSEGERHGALHPDGLDNAQMWSLQEAIKAHPRRDDPVAAWLKRKRDEWLAHEDIGEDHPKQWYAIDALLDDYRLHADTGTPLSEDVQGPHGEGA